jgi:hypothetical protein
MEIWSKTGNRNWVQKGNVNSGNRNLIENRKRIFFQKQEMEIRFITGNRNSSKKQETEIWSKNRKQKFGQKTGNRN